MWVRSCSESYSQQPLPSEWARVGVGWRWAWAGGGRGLEVGGAGVASIPAFLVPGVVPFDEALGTLQLRMQAVLLAAVPGHALGGYAETEQNRGTGLR